MYHPDMNMMKQWIIIKEEGRKKKIDALVYAEGFLTRCGTRFTLLAQTGKNKSPRKGHCNVGGDNEPHEYRLLISMYNIYIYLYSVSNAFCSQRWRFLPISLSLPTAIHILNTLHTQHSHETVTYFRYIVLCLFFYFIFFLLHLTLHECLLEICDIKSPVCWELVGSVM